MAFKMSLLLALEFLREPSNIGVPTCIWDEEAQKTESTFRAIARDI